MGANPSKPGERCVAPPSRKHLKPRSSLNLLKRTRTPSNATRASCPLPETVLVGGPAYAGSRDHVEERVSPEYQQSSSNASALSSTSEENEDESEPDSASQYSTPEPVTRLTTPRNGHRDGQDASTPQSEDSRLGTPALSMTPKTLLAPPAMLPEDSPTKYGLRTTRTPSPEKGMTRAQRMKITGPGLFAHSVAQLKSYHAPNSIAKSSSFSRSSPCLLSTSGRQHEHANYLPNRSAGPPTGSYHDLLSGVADYYNVVHALPMLPAQIDCFHGHDDWHPAAKPRCNMLHPVSCAVCDGYGAPSEGHETAGDDFRRCTWCWLIVCGKCYDAFKNGGTPGMMDRQSGLSRGARVIEVSV